MTDKNLLSMESLTAALNRLHRDGYQISINVWTTGTVYISLNKSSHSGATVTVNGDGETLHEAVDKVMLNFPTHPLDGSEWKIARLAASSPSSEPMVDGEFTEIPF